MAIFKEVAVVLIWGAFKFKIYNILRIGEIWIK